MDTKLLEERFRLSRNHLLGEGGFACVYKGLDTIENRQVAIKLYKDVESAKENFIRSIDVMKKVAACTEENVLETFLEDAFMQDCSIKTPQSMAVGMVVKDALKRQETKTAPYVKMTQMIRKIDLQNNFVQLISHSKDEKGGPGLDSESDLLYIVTELGDETLCDRIRAHSTDGRGIMPVDTLRELQWCIVSIVCILHTVGFVHLDIKPVNIMRFGDSWKLLDFDGVVKSGTELPHGKLVSTPVYMAPEVAAVIKEVHDGNEKASLRVSRLCDVWSVGVCAMETIFSQPVLGPWYNEWRNETQGDEKFIEWLSDFEKQLMDEDMIAAMDAIDKDMSDLLQGMLSKNPQTRTSIGECLVHPWFESVREDMWVKIGNIPTATPEEKVKKKSRACDIM